MARPRITLPTMCPRKKIAVVTGLASYVGLNLKGKIPQNVRQIQGLSNESKEAGQSFLIELIFHIQC